MTHMCARHLVLDVTCHFVRNCEIITGGACGCAFLKPSACRRFDSDDSVKVSTFAGLRYKGLQGVIK
jgi:hypothetical protein